MIFLARLPLDMAIPFARNFFNCAFVVVKTLPIAAFPIKKPRARRTPEYDQLYHMQDEHLL